MCKIGERSLYSEVLPISLELDSASFEDPPLFRMGVGEKEEHNARHDHSLRILCFPKDVHMWPSLRLAEMEYGSK